MEDSVGRRFQIETAIDRLPVSDQKRGLPQPPVSLRLCKGQELDLPRVDDAWGEVPLAAAIRARRSLREYSDAPVSLAELAALLWATQGVERVWEGQEPAKKPGGEPRPHRATFRTVPSAGARHAFETLVLASRVDGLSPGVYQYLPIEHRLLGSDFATVRGSELAAACLDQRMIGAAALTFAWVAIRDRMTWRYGERGYRYLYLDAGHVCQNLYLACEAIGAGTCAIGAYDDAAVNTLFHLDGESAFVVYMASVGKRALQTA